MTIKLQSLCELHRVRTARRARELEVKSGVLREIQEKYERQVNEQNALYEASDTAITRLADSRSGLLDADSVQFASSFSVGSRWRAWDKIEPIAALRLELDAALEQRAQAHATWKLAERHRQAITKLEDTVTSRERMRRAAIHENSVDEAFVDARGARLVQV